MILVELDHDLCYPTIVRLNQIPHFTYDVYEFVERPSPHEKIHWWKWPREWNHVQTIILYLFCISTGCLRVSFSLALSAVRLIVYMRESITMDKFSRLNSKQQICLSYRKIQSSQWFYVLCPLPPLFLSLAASIKWWKRTIRCRCLYLATVWYL